MPSISGVAIIGAQSSGTVISNATRTFNFIGATVTETAPGLVQVDVTSGASGANVNLTNLVAPVKPNQNLDFDGVQRIVGLPAPLAADEATNKGYVDSLLGSYMNTNFSNAVASAIDLDLGSNKIVNLANPTNPQDAATKAYVDAGVSGWGLLGNAVAAGQFFGSTNAQAVVIKQNNVETAQFNSTGFSINQGKFNFVYASNSFRFGATATGGALNTVQSSLAFGSASNAGSIRTQGTGALAFGQTVTGGGSLSADGVGSCVHGLSNAGSIIASGAGSKASGQIDGASNITASGIGSQAFGYLVAGTNIASSGAGSFVYGHVNGTNAAINASGSGSTAFGYSHGTNSTIQCGSLGSLAFGEAANGGIIVVSNSNGSLRFGNVDNSQISGTNDDGSLVFGYVRNGSAIYNQGRGSLMFGYADGLPQMGSGGKAAFVSGYIGGTLAVGAMSGTGDGSTVRGASLANATMLASALAATTWGHATGNGTSIHADGVASVAWGYAQGGLSFYTQARASFVMGSATNFNIFMNSTAEGSLTGGISNIGIIAQSGKGAIAWGDDLSASGDYAQTFGVGNAQTNYCSFFAGRYAASTGGTANAWVAADALFVLGNGASNASRSDAFRVGKDGHLLTTGGHVNKAIRAISGPDVLSDRTDHTIIYDTTGAGGAITLPAGVDGMEFRFGPKGAGAAVYTLSPSFATLGPGIGALSGTTALQIQYLAGVWYKIG